MALTIEGAAKQFVESEFFIKGVLAYDFVEIEEQLVQMLLEYHKFCCITAVRVYSQNRLSTDQIVKPALRTMEPVRFDFYRKKWKGLAANRE